MYYWLEYKPDDEPTFFYFYPVLFTALLQIQFY